MRVHRQQSDCPFDAEDVIEHSATFDSVLLACSFGMDAERAKIFSDGVPVGDREAPGPVFDIEALVHVFVEDTDVFHGVPSQHHEAWFSDDVGVQIMIEPPAEEFLSVMKSRDDVLPSELPEFFVKVCRCDIFLAIVFMIARDEPNGWVCFENVQRALEVVLMPDVILEEELEKGNVRLCPSGFAETSVPVAADAAARWIACEGDVRIF